MAVTLNSTGITFSDGNSQNSAVTGGVTGTYTSTVANNPGSVSLDNSSLALIRLEGGGGGGSWARRQGGLGGNASFVLSGDENGTLSYNVGAGGNPGSSPVGPPSQGQPGGTTSASGPSGTFASALGGQGARGGNPSPPAQATEKVGGFNIGSGADLVFGLEGGLDNRSPNASGNSSNSSGQPGRIRIDRLS